MNLEFYNYYGDLAFAYTHQNHLKVKPLLEWFSQEDSSPQSFKMGKNPASKLAKSTHPLSPKRFVLGPCLLLSQMTLIYVSTTYINRLLSLTTSKQSNKGRIPQYEDRL